jgi:hypothetical protein
MRSRSKSRQRSMRQKGGNYPDSAWGYQLNNLGNGWTQFMNSLSLQPGANLGAVQSNAIVPIKNINAQTAQPALSPKMTGGRRHRRSRKGGNLVAVVEQAAVPLVLLGMQQRYKKKNSRKHNSSRKNKSRKH